MKNKVSITTAITVLTMFPAIAQDIITYKNGDEKKVKVMEVLPGEVKYKNFDNLDGPLYSEEKTKIFMIKYENGYKEVMTSSTARSANVPPVIAAEPAKPAGFEKELTVAPDLRSLDREGLPNYDVIMTLIGDTIQCNIEQVTSTYITYNIARHGMDDRGGIQMAKVRAFYRERNRNPVVPATLVQPVLTPLKKTESPPVVTEQDEDEFLPVARRYGGPRMGLTYVGPGIFSDALAAEGKRNLYSQFGWQFEKRLFTTKTGISSVVEFVPLLGGLDMGKCIPSASLLLGIRLKNGVEFGAGPNAAIYGYKDAKGYYNTSSSFGIVIAAGMSFKSDKVYFPVNIAFIPSVGKKVTAIDPDSGTQVQKQVETGAKISLLVGFNYRKK